MVKFNIRDSASIMLTPVTETGSNAFERIKPEREETKIVKEPVPDSPFASEPVQLELPFDSSTEREQVKDLIAGQ